MRVRSCVRARACVRVHACLYVWIGGDPGVRGVACRLTVREDSTGVGLQLGRLPCDQASPAIDLAEERQLGRVAPKNDCIPSEPSPVTHPCSPPPHSTS